MSETATVTLAEFLLARIAEDEARARARAFTEDCIPKSGPPNPRPLAECEAKRRIVERASAAGQVLGYDARWAFTETLRDLASVYADHPDNHVLSEAGIEAMHA